VDVITGIAKLADVGALCRGVVSVWQDDQGNINFQPPNIEQPHRFAALLYNLARGHALLSGRTQLTADDLPTVTRVALDSMPLERRKLLRLLIAGGPQVQRTATEVKRTLGCSKPTALRLMRELALLEVADPSEDLWSRDDQAGPPPVRPPLTIALPQRFAWLATRAVQDALDVALLGEGDTTEAPEDDA
jgi:hypothetical protein